MTFGKAREVWIHIDHQSQDMLCTRFLVVVGQGRSHTVDIHTYTMEHLIASFQRHLCSLLKHGRVAVSCKLAVRVERLACAKLDPSWRKYPKTHMPTIPGLPI